MEQLNPQEEAIYASLMEKFDFSVHPYYWDKTNRRQLMFLYLLFRMGLDRTMPQGNMIFFMGLELDGKNKGGDYLRSITISLTRIAKLFSATGTNSLRREYRTNFETFPILQEFFHARRGQRRARYALYFLVQNFNVRMQLWEANHHRMLPVHNPLSKELFDLIEAHRYERPPLPE